MITFGLVASVLGFVLLVDAILSHRRMSAALASLRLFSAPPPERYPSLTVVRPLRGRDVGAEQNIAAALDTDYPGELETLFVFDEPNDPALPVVRAAVAAHERAGAHGSASILVVGSPPPGRTGKLNAMIEGERLARGELIAFGDSDTRPDRSMLRKLVERLLATPEAGAAFAPVVVANPLRTAGDVGYALMINSLYTPAAVLAASRPDLSFIMGQTMVFRRPALAAIGGVACAEGQLVDDMHIGLCVARAGYRNVMSAHPLALATGGMSLYEFAQLMRRWLIFGRSGLPLSFIAPHYRRAASFWISLVLALVALATGHPLAAMLAFAAALATGASLSRLHSLYGGAPIPLAYRWMAFALFLVSPAMLLATVFAREVTWRGRPYALRQTRLAQGEAPAK